MYQVKKTYAADPAVGASSLAGEQNYWLSTCWLCYLGATGGAALLWVICK